jgi:hypothetical protein
VGLPRTWVVWGSCSGLAWAPAEPAGGWVFGRAGTREPPLPSSFDRPEDSGRLGGDNGGLAGGLPWVLTLTLVA